MSTTPEDPFQSRPEGSQPAPSLPPYEQPPYAQPQYQAPQYAPPPFQEQPPQYAQQPGMMPPNPMQPPYGQPVGPRPGAEKNWMGITSLVLGLAGLVTWFTAIGGIVLGHMGRAAARRGEADNSGMSLAGLIISYIVTVSGLLLIVGVIILFGWLVTECGGDNPASWCDPDATYTWEATAA